MAFAQTPLKELTVLLDLARFREKASGKETGKGGTITKGKGKMRDREEGPREVASWLKGVRGQYSSFWQC